MSWLDHENLDDHDVDELARFDHFLTDSVSGRLTASLASGLDPTMIATVQSVRAQDVVPGPTSAFGEQLWQTLLRSASEPWEHPFDRLAVEVETAGKPIPLRPVPNVRPGPGVARPRSRGGLLGSRAVSLLATAALFLLTVGAALSILLPAVNEPAGEGAEDHVYVASSDGSAFQQVDPKTLANLAAAPIPVRSESFGYIWFADWIASADGSTLVRIEVEPSSSDRYGKTNFSVFNARTGNLRSRFEVPEWKQSSPLLSADGTTLVVELPARVAHQSNGRLVIGRAASWQVFDTGTGRLVATIQAEDQAVAGLIRTGIIDPGGKHLYRISARGDQDSVGPWPSQIVVHDLHTGQETGRIELDEVRSGFWWTGATDASEPIGPGYVDSYLVPSMVFTPDGSMLMVLEGDASAVTVIEIATGVSRRVALDPAVVQRTYVPSSERMDRFFPYATFLTSIGSDARAYAAPDGQHLLLGGLRRERDDGDAGGVWVDDLGLQLIELDGTASVLATAAFTTFAVDPAKDGSAYYIKGYRSEELAAGVSQQAVFARIASSTLTVEAERDGSRDTASLLVLEHALPEAGLSARPGGTPGASLPSD